MNRLSAIFLIGCWVLAPSAGWAMQAASSASLYEQGRALADAKRYAEADAALIRYVAEHPDSADALYLLGYVQQREDKPADSLQTYTEAAKLRAPRSEDLANVALDYVLLKD